MNDVPSEVLTVLLSVADDVERQKRARIIHRLLLIVGVAIAMLSLLLLAPAPAVAAPPSLGTVLECGLPATEALDVLREHGIEADQKRVTLATPITAYGVQVGSVTAWKLGNMLGVTYTISTATLPEFSKAAALKEWDDEDGAGLGRAFLNERNGLTAPHVADAVGDVVEIDCGMRERAP
ncbi:hypothetical protein [Xanthomonas citri]|uniref:hypothetical protein n=1 Tax=Xanthomonas citri TaxID=346 RepID=UPI001599FFD8|nr:hypothetical protein [Xanthomonas citri]MBE0315566.1 hypothetical protein [Xanthomonas citri pv. punicae]MDS0832477.1 hypothetical protein [Xanthomonas citri pv. punicae]MDS0836342.1 hypothetical protein [Xanthomonas citri pv. punicae]QCZ72257.1 hypothetical protein CAB38_04885 [Xanthomonas citri pv. punicae]UIE42601.1 hypothetical protein FICKIIDM_01709 [Xanthomonas citri pv. punicae]